MASDERMFTIPLRKELLKAPKYKRSTKAVRATRAYLIKKTHADNVLIGQELNHKLHEHGRKYPPTKIQVKVYKFKEKLIANLPDVPMLKEEEPKKKTTTEKIKEKVIPQEEDKKKILEKPQEKKEEIKAPKEKIPPKTGEVKGKKELFPKDEKPKHEKKK
jgi:large subunit ribosomal protein L31e